jgi:protein O-mannosyl-transferase
VLDRSADDPGGDAQRGAMLWRAALLLAVLVSFAPLYRAEFTQWDDRYNIVENPRLNPPTWAGVAYHWTHTAYDLYIPVTYTAWAGLAWLGYVAEPDAVGSHLNPYLFHAANVLLHAVATLVVFEILRRLFRRNLAAGCGALFFALHPVQVEAVGWVAGLKDILAGFLSLAALYFYLDDERFAPSPGTPGEGRGEGSSPPKQKDPHLNPLPEYRERRSSTSVRFAAAILLFILAMLSKPIAMVVPVIALTMDLILQRRPLRQALVRFAILLPFSIACAITSKLIQPAKYDFVQVPLYQRPLIAMDALAFYLYKLVWPVRLGLDYGRSPQQAIASGWPYFTWIVPGAIAILLWLNRRRRPALAAGGAIFVIALSPSLGLAPFDFQLYSTVADHYLYLPMLGLAIALASIAPQARQRVYLTIWLLVCCVFAILTWRQTRVWQDSTTLFTHAIEINPKSWASHSNLAQALERNEQYESAERECRLALAQHPGHISTYADLGNCLRALHKPEEALAAYHEALPYADPKDPLCWSALGNLLSAADKPKEAAEAFRRAVALSPEDAGMRTNLAAILAEQGSLEEAIDLYQSALKITPTLPAALAGLEEAKKELAERTNHTAATSRASPG